MKLFKYLLRFGLFALCLICITLAFLPLILSSHWGNKQLSSFLSMSMKASVQIESIDLNWFKKQSIQNISIASPEYSFQAHSITLSHGLWKFLFNGLQFKQIEMNTPKLQIVKIPSSPAPSKHHLLPFFSIHTLKIANGLFTLTSKEHQLIAFDAIEATSNFYKQTQTVELSVRSSTSYAEKQGKIDFSGYLSYRSSFPQFALQSQIIDLPLEGIDQLAILLQMYHEPILTESFGKTLNMHCHIDSKTQKLETTIHSQNLHLNIDTTHQTPLTLNWNVNPKLLALFHLPIEKPFSLAVSADTLHLPSFEHYKKLALNMKASLSNLDLKSIQLKGVELNIETSNLSELLKINGSTQLISPMFSGEMSMQGLLTSLFHNPKHKILLSSNTLEFIEPFSSLKRRISDLRILLDQSTDHSFATQITLEDLNQPSLLGNDCHLSMTGTTFLSPKHIEINHFDLNISSSVMKGHFTGSLHFLNKELKLAKDGYIDYKLTPAVFKRLMSPLPFPLSLKKETSVSLLIEKSSSMNQLDANLFSEDFVVTVSRPHQDFDFRNFDSHLTFKPHTEALDITAQMNIGEKGKVSLKANQQDKHLLHTRMQAKQIPANLFAPWITPSISLERLIGKYIDFNCVANYHTNYIQTLDMDVSSQFLSAKGGFQFNPNGFLTTITSPFSIELTLTPESYHTLSRQSPSSHSSSQLLKPAQFSLYCPKYKINPAEGFASSEMRMECSIKDFAVQQASVEATLSYMKFDVRKKKNENAIATLSGILESKGQKSEIDGSIDITQIDPSRPFLDMLQKMHIHSSLNISKVPSIILDALSQPFAPFPFSKILGKELNANIDLNIQQGVQEILMNIVSSDSNLHIHGTAVQNKFFLNTPLTGSLKLTPQLSALLFENLGFSVIKSRLPITLTISDQGFFLPFSQDPFIGMRIPSIVLDPGQIVAMNQGTPEGINNLFKMQGSHSMQFWFAPIHMNYVYGKLFVQRTEILIDGRYHICLWGDIDYLNRYVNMTVGLTAQSLRATLGIQGLPSNYVLMVPLKGSFGNVELQTSAITAKLALLLGEKISSDSPFGGVVSLFNQVMNDQSKVPPPRHPYPWESDAAATEMPSSKVLKLKQTKERDEEMLSTPQLSIYQFAR